MGQVVVRVESRATWDQSALRKVQLQKLRNIADAHRRQGGITALFSGPSGTGKTLAAEVLAHDLGHQLFRVDLAQAVSKWIGETEKNLGRLFDVAERTGAILLFDEADALFGKRTEVKDSHDRYANVETGYLLERIEAYPGLVIGAAIKKTALDDAFVRLLRFVVEFPLADQDERTDQPMLQLDPSDSLDLVFALKKAVK